MSKWLDTVYDTLCPQCGGPEFSSTPPYFKVSPSDCLCAGRGMVTREQARRWRNEQMAKRLPPEETADE